MGYSMNITLSADRELIRKMREYAARRGTSLNELIRGYMKSVAGATDSVRKAEEFEQLARERGGASPEGYRFNRDESHSR